MLENLELQLGVVGPAAFGKEIQNDWHQLIGIRKARGWGNQLQNEPGVVLSYERLWRLPILGDAGAGVDIVPQLGGSAGNVFTFAEAGALLRFGKNLGTDYGPVRVRPALSGTDYFDADGLDGPVGVYGFIGVQGRAVAHNIFLDGNSFRDSRDVDKEPLVADFLVGFSLFWSSSLRIDVSAVRRTREFEGQSHPDVIGSAAFSFSW
jgi:hypothetical protein